MLPSTPRATTTEISLVKGTKASSTSGLGDRASKAAAAPRTLLTMRWPLPS